MKSLAQRHPDLFWGGMLLALALSLRLFLLGDKSLWLDEAVSLRLSAIDLPEILANGSDPHPPLYYLLLHFWLVWGRTELVLRLPSAIVGALSVPLLYKAGKDLLGERVGVIAAFLLAVAPLHIWYSQEARMYSMVTFWGIASVFFLIRAVIRGGSLYWIGYMVALLAGLYTDYSMLMLVALEAISLLALSRRFYLTPARWWAWLGTQVVLVVGFLPWWPRLIETVRNAAGFHALIRLRFLRSDLVAETSNGEAVRWLIGGIALVALAAALTAIWIRRGPRSSISVALWTLLPYSLLTALSGLSQGNSIKRLLVILIPYVFLAVAQGMDRLKGYRSLAIVSGLALALFFTGTNYFVVQKENWRDAATVVQEMEQPGDVVLMHPSYASIPFQYYYRGRSAVVEVSEGGFDGQLSPMPSRFRRAWVLLSHDSYVDPAGNVQRWLNQNWILLENKDFVGIAMRLYRTSREVMIPGGTL